LPRQFFQNLCSAADPVGFIRSLSNSNPPSFESDWLDFKQQPQPPDLTNSKWRDIWAEALGGFSNNQGGVIIWGLDARKDKATNIDAAGDVKPISNPFGVKSRLIELQRQATDPVVLNVEIEAYEESPGSGFVVCYIPEGAHKPYRTEDGRRSQYYLRAADNFVPMSRSVLASLFYPKSVARFRVVVSWRSHIVQLSSRGDIYANEIVCSAGIVNTG
jgi:predicted HTH transcriptional regulator